MNAQAVNKLSAEANDYFIFWGVFLVFGPTFLSATSSLQSKNQFFLE
jgi:hypothetical protein